jgi:membrane associated rhomboid family serine protease
MIPIKDINPTYTRPIVTKTLVIINIIIFFWTYLDPNFPNIVQRWGAKPVYILQGRELETIITSMFLHGGPIHLFGNMIYLWIFGDNVEDIMGHTKFLIFYIASGIAGTYLNAFLDPLSNIPGIGASGAISGIMGAYVVLYPGARVLSLLALGYYITTVEVNAYIFVGIWFIYQLLYAMISLYIPHIGGVAYWAHIGGFILGSIVALTLRDKLRYRLHRLETEITHV